MPSQAMTATLYASLWHALFFSSHRKDNDSGRVTLSTLTLLDAVGFAKAGDLAERLERSAATKNAGSLANVSSKLAGAAAKAESCKSGTWAQLFVAKAAVAILSGEPVDLRAVLASVATPPSSISDGSTLFHTLANDICAPTAAASDRGASSDVFSLLNCAAAQLAPHDDEARVRFVEAKLYAALCLHGLFPTAKPLAKLLTTYIHQDCEPVARDLAEVQSLFEQNSHQKPSARAAATASVEQHRQATEARARGVIAGLLECALAAARGAPASVMRALDDFKTASVNGSNENEMNQLPAFGPRPEQCTALLTATALTFVQMVRQADELKASAAGKDAGILDGVCFSGLVVHTVQELLFTAVLGAGTVNMPNRPARPQQPPTTSNSTNSASEAETHTAVTHRPLTLTEADALMHDVFPCLLQQVGYEWPWSELLRHCRGLDKVQVSPPFPYVALPSSLMIDTVLLCVAGRTYPQRLLHLLPPSFDNSRRTLEIEPSPAAGRADGDGAGDGLEPPQQRRRKPDLFTLPAYYKDAVDPVMEYYTRAGLSGLRADEVERVLRQSVSTLPMIVQLRARAPPEEDDEEWRNANAEEGVSHGKGSKAYLLTRARMTVLETRFALEALLVSLIVHTQLETHSRVQSMMRELTPLLLKLSMTLNKYAGALATPLLVRRSSSTYSNGAGYEEDSNSLVFSEEAERLMDDIGYQFYPLEWLPALSQAYHEQQQRHERRGQDALVAPVTAFSAKNSAFPYSPFAAVAHQLGAAFRSPMGSERGNCPAGARASLVTAPRAPTSLTNDTSRDDGCDMYPLKRAARMLEGLMLPCWLDSRLSSCNLEGTMAVTATRVVGSGSGAGGGAAGDDGLLARLNRLLKPHILEMFWANDEEARDEENVEGNEERNADAAHGRERAREEGADNGHRLLEKDEDAARVLANALLQNGASSYELAMEGKDFVMTVMQCFLPEAGSMTTRAGAAGKPGAKWQRPSSSGMKFTAELMRGALAWCRATSGSAAVRAQVRMQLQQKPPQGTSVDQAFAGIYNSCTFDVCELARRVLWREVPTRLLSKLRLRYQQSADLLRRRDRCIRCIYGKDDGASECKNVGHAEVDPLLLHQWSQYVGLLQRLAQLGDSGLVPAETPELSAAQWVWYSPYANS